MPHEVKLVTEGELRQVIDLDLKAIDCVEDAFSKLATGDVVMPPILSMDLPDINAEVDVKTAFVPGLEGFALKVSPGFFNNPALGLPSLNGLMMVLSAKTGLVEAVLLDNGYLTDIRTAAAGAVAARHLAPKNTECVGILGSGVQAGLQLIAATKVCGIKKALIWGRNSDKAELLATELRDQLGLDVQACSDKSTVIADSQLVVTTTPSKEPLISAEDLHPGLHITAMGSDQESKNELDPAILAKADRVVCDRISQCEKLGELRSAIAAGVYSISEDLLELGSIVNGTSQGRQSDDDITICDLTGTGVQDTAIATLALEQARNSQAGTSIWT